MKRASVLVLLTLSVAAMTFASPQQTRPAPDQVSTVVTVINHRSGPMPSIVTDDIIVRQNGERRPMVNWQPLTGAHAGMDVAVLIDDSLEASVSLQWPAIKDFIRNLPQGSRVATVYGTGSRAEFAQEFTTNRELAMKALRLPRGDMNEGSSIYLSLEALLKRWPEDHNRRVVLLISDGIDLFYGVRESEAGQNINLQKAMNLAQKKGVIVDSIFASGAAAYSRNFYLVGNGQSCLGRLAFETGGRSYTTGFQTPVDMAPFLKQIADSFTRQYRLTFRAKLPRKAGFARLQLKTEQHGIELRSASRVYLPAAH